MLQTTSNPATDPEKNYIKTATALRQRAGMYALAGYTPEMIQQNPDMKRAIGEFKTARELVQGKEDSEVFKAVVEQMIHQGTEKLALQNAALNSRVIGTTSAPVAALKVVSMKQVAADAKVPAANVKYTPKKNEGLAAIAAQLPLVAAAKEAVCHGNTDDKSAELVTAIAIARHNPEVTQIDLIRADKPLSIPNVAELEQYVAQIKQTGLLANCHIGYAADVQGRNVADFFPAQRAPVMASLRAASK